MVQVTQWLIANKELLTALIIALWYIYREVMAFRTKQTLNATQNALGATTSGIETVETRVRGYLATAITAAENLDVRQKDVILMALKNGTAKSLKGMIKTMNLDEKTRAVLENAVDQARISS